MSLPDDVSVVNARPNFAVADVERSVAFYRDVLGFEATAVMGEPPNFALLHGGGAEIALRQERDVKPSGCYVYVTGVEALLKHCEAQGVNVTYPLTLEPWGILNFVIEDPDGHRIAIGERQAQSSEGNTVAAMNAIASMQEVQQEGARTPAPLDPHAGSEDCLKPVIARVNGYAVGGGNHLAYFSDFTIASENATFMQVAPCVGSPPSGYVVANLTHGVGVKKAKEMWMTTRRYSGREALEMGLVNTVVAPEELDAEVDRWCAELLQKSPSCLKILNASFKMVYEPMKVASARSWVKQIAPDFYTSGEADEGKNAFLERRETDLSRFPRQALRWVYSTGEL